MKTSFKPSWTHLVLATMVALAAVMTACGKKDKGSTAAVDGRGRSAGEPVAPVSPLGYIKDKSAYVTSIAPSGSPAVSNFERGVKDFLQSTWDPQYAGAIDDSSFIINGYLEMANATTFNTAASYLNIWVMDSLAKDKVPDENGNPAVPYFVSFRNATSGTIAGNKFTIVFKDDYQEVTLDGTFDANVAAGKFSFRNLKDALGKELKSANPMGYFTIPACQLLNCRKQ
jgi:hypothetical protein